MKHQLKVKMENTKNIQMRKFKHYATDEIIEIEIKNEIGIYKGKSYKVVKDKHNRINLFGTSFFEIPLNINKLKEILL